MAEKIAIAVFLLLFSAFVVLAFGQTPDGTRVPPATQLVTLSGDIWALGNKDSVLAGAFEILKNGVSLGTARAGQLALCNGDIYAFSVRDQNWWRINANNWTHTVTIPCAAVSTVFTPIPLQAGQTICIAAVVTKISPTVQAMNNIFWADTPDCSHMRGATLYKSQTTAGAWCTDTDPNVTTGIWLQTTVPCVRPLVGIAP